MQIPDPHPRQDADAATPGVTVASPGCLRFGTAMLGRDAHRVQDACIVILILRL
jgi:hypothetical protein